MADLAPPGGEGWNLISLDANGSNVTLGVWWKLAAASESSTHTFTWTGSEEAYGYIMRFIGHDTTSPVEVSAVAGITGATGLRPASLASPRFSASAQPSSTR